MFEVEILTHQLSDPPMEWEKEAFRSLVDLVESAVGKEFAEELDRVEVRIAKFGPFDDHKADWLVRIIVDESDMHSSMVERTENFHLQFRGFLTDLGLSSKMTSSTVRVVSVTGIISERWN